MVFAALALLVLVIGAGFAVAGAWLILPFAGLEVLLLGAAYFFYARHAADYERIELERGRLTVEIAEAERVEHHEFDAKRARVRLENERIVLRDAKEELELGRHLDAQARVELAAELEKRLIRGKGT
jgi:uncharacterized membrane protein